MRAPAGAGIFLLGVVLEWAWGTYAAPGGVAPEVLVVLTVAVALRAGPAAGQCFAFSWGLFMDFLGPRLFGANALALTLAAYGFGLARRQMDLSSPLSQATVVGVVSAAHFAFVALTGLVFEGSALWPGLTSFVVVSLLNAIVAPLAFALVGQAVRP